MNDIEETSPQIFLRRCTACGQEENLHEHHVIPKYIDKYSSHLITLCKKHHDILHHMIEKVIYQNRFETEEKLRGKIKTHAEWFCKLEWMKWQKKPRQFFTNHCILCRSPAKFGWWDYENEMGLFGLCESCQKWEDSEYKKYNGNKKPEKNFADWLTENEINRI